MKTRTKLKITEVISYILAFCFFKMEGLFLIILGWQLALRHREKSEIKQAGES